MHKLISAALVVPFFISSLAFAKTTYFRGTSTHPAGKDGKPKTNDAYVTLTVAPKGDRVTVYSVKPIDDKTAQYSIYEYVRKGDGSWETTMGKSTIPAVVKLKGDDLISIEATWKVQNDKVLITAACPTPDSYKSESTLVDEKGNRKVLSTFQGTKMPAEEYAAGAKGIKFILAEPYVVPAPKKKPAAGKPGTAATQKPAPAASPKPAQKK